MRKRDSKRRWKARVRLGRFIPAWVLMCHKLPFNFRLVSLHGEYLMADMEGTNNAQ
jgi:hypothetical protein